MTAKVPIQTHTDGEAYIITGPTSGIGRATAFEVAKHGTVILVGRNLEKLSEVGEVIQKTGGRAVPVLCDLSDLVSVWQAAEVIRNLGFSIAGLLNNAGIMQEQPTKNTAGWDMTFATDHIGPFALTEALVPHLRDGANVVFVTSTVEDPERNPGKAVGYRGARYVSAQASACGEWQPGGSKLPGADAYATSKQCNLVTAMAFARETSRLHFNAVTPGLIPTTGLFQRDNKGMSGKLSKHAVPLLIPLLMPFLRFLSTPKHAARIICKLLVQVPGKTGIYYDERGKPMAGSVLARDQQFQDRVVAETRALLENVRHQRR